MDLSSSCTDHSCQMYRNTIDFAFWSWIFQCNRTHSNHLCFVYLGHLCCDMFKIAMSPMPSLFSHFQGEPERRWGGQWKKERKEERMRCHTGKPWRGVNFVASLWQSFLPEVLIQLVWSGSQGPLTVFNPRSRHFLLEFGPQMDFLSRTNFSLRPPCQAVFCLRHFSLHHSFISISSKSTSCRPFFHLCPFSHTLKPWSRPFPLFIEHTPNLHLFWLAPEHPPASSSMFWLYGRQRDF